MCGGESKFHDRALLVKFKWLRPIKIGNRNETEWAYEAKPYNDFIGLLTSYYEDNYRKHNWVYKRQDAERRNNRRRLQPGHAILEFDYAAKATQFQQDCMPCSAARQTSNFVVFAHFDPNLDDAGNNVADTTEVFCFHSNCLIQDTHSIRRCLTHVVENLTHRRHLNAKVVHMWADGCAAQNKGRKSFRQLSEVSLTLSMDIVMNFAASHHFAGPWDTEGGRHTRAVRNHIRNERDTTDTVSVLDAGDNVRLLRKLLNKSGQPDSPVPSQVMWRPTGSVTTTPDVDVPVPRVKPIRQARGRTDAELEDDDTDTWYNIRRRHILQVEPCVCRGDCSCPADGRLTYKRDEHYDCSPINGTMSTYCFRFFKKALHAELREFSCYCRWCSRCVYNKCINLDIVRHKASMPVKPSHAGYTRWRDTGWRRINQVIKSTPDQAVTRTVDQSIDAALEYVLRLSLGKTIAVMTNIDGSPSFWLATKHSEPRKAVVNDPDTGIKRGETILSVVWYDRLTTYKYIKLDDVTIVSVSSICVVPFPICWQKTTTNRFYLGEHTHTLLMDLVSKISEM